MEFEQLTQQIIGCAMRVHSTLGAGFLESVYHNALGLELRNAGLRVNRKAKLKVMYEGSVVGVFFPDMLVEDVIVVENKSVLSLAAAHEAQLVNYLTATGIDIGLLFNFGAERLEFRRKHRVYRKPNVDRMKRDG